MQIYATTTTDTITTSAINTNGSMDGITNTKINTDAILGTEDTSIDTIHEKAGTSACGDVSVSQTNKQTNK